MSGRVLCLSLGAYLHQLPSLLLIMNRHPVIFNIRDILSGKKVKFTNFTCARTINRPMHLLINLYRHWVARHTGRRLLGDSIQKAQPMLGRALAHGSTNMTGASVINYS
ncbi:hypothetical protein GGR55DRAFT_605974 [Xylaria sp. FL0064]|nr:hypothetical protein GGR55DRAFT_605974 [Xylaria sp. FL0064]